MKDLIAHIAKAIVEFVIFFNIGFDDIDKTNMEELHNAFVKKLSKYSHDKLKGTGLALMLRGNVDFLIRKWGTREGCKESEKFLIGVKEHSSATGEEFIADRARKFIRELPFKQEQWVSTNEKWRELVESYLSDSYIDHWWKDLSLRRHTADEETASLSFAADLVYWASE